MRIALPLVLVFSCLFLTACGSASDDAETLCTIATEVVNDSTVGPENRGSTVARRFDETSMTSDTRAAFEAVANASPEVRYELMQAAFREQGVDGWECPAVRQVWGLE